MSVKGNLKDIALTSLIQMNCQSGMTGRLTVKHGEQQANVYFAEGNIVHALSGSRSGKEAFYELLEWEDGQFELAQDSISPEQTIATHWSDLLLGGLHQLDERTTPEQETNAKPSISPENIGELFGFEKSSITGKEADMAQNMREILVELGQEVPGFMATAIVGMDGLGVANHAAGSIDVETINAQMTLLFKLVNKSVDKLGAGSMQDFLLTTDKAYLLIRYLSDRNYYLGIVADRRKANLGNMRLYSRVFAGKLSKAMPR
jgi:predicted regulator of Ras-like GTPase activity (Roadblock/LC7/MglB family)